MIVTTDSYDGSIAAPAKMYVREDPLTKMSGFF